MSGGLHSLATIIKRLEAATSRLEDLAVDHAHKVPRKEEIRDELNPGAYSISPASASTSPAPPKAEDPKSVIAFDELVINAQLKPFLALTRSFAGSSVVEQVTLVEKEFFSLRSLIHLAASCSKPDQKVLGELLGPLEADIKAVTRVKDDNRKDRGWFTHLSTVAEGAPCIGWVAVPTPVTFVNEIKDSTLFYGNRVIKDFKENDTKHVEWVRAYTAVLEGMRKYVKEHHTTGLVWNPKGISVAEYKAAAKGTTPSSDIPPPPPPPPPPATSSGGAAPAGGVAAVFADLNRGEDVTKGLRKVDKNEMTHKNPTLRAGGVVSSSTGSSPVGKKPVKPTKPHSLSGKKPSKFALEGNKWVIEYQENESGLVVEKGELSHTVNLFGCKSSTVVIKGKVNAVTLVDCKKVSVLVESVISSISVTSSPSFALQITGFAPTIQLDSTDSGQIYLSKDCLGVEITTAKCSSINVSLPVQSEDEGVFEEQAVPEMLKTVVKDGKLVTTVVDHVG